MSVSMAGLIGTDSIEDNITILENQQLSNLRTSRTARTSRTSKPFPFPRLPAELRNNVYAHIMADEVVMRKTFLRSPSYTNHQLVHPWWEGEAPKSYTGLNGVCRQLRNGFCPLLYRGRKLLVPYCDLSEVLASLFPEDGINIAISRVTVP
jgi:hypothetical protein